MGGWMSSKLRQVIQMVKLLGVPIGIIMEPNTLTSASTC